MIAMKQYRWISVGLVVLCFIGAALILPTKMPDTIVVNDLGSVLKLIQPIFWATGLVLFGSFFAALSSGNEHLWKGVLLIGLVVGIGFVLLVIFWLLPAFLFRLG